MPYHLDGYSLFDDKGEVKRLVDSVIQQIDSRVTIDRLRKIDFSYIFTLKKNGKIREVELTREQIDASGSWRNGGTDPTLQMKIEKAIDQLQK